MHYHELIINVKSDNYGNEDKTDFWHADCYAEMIIKDYKEYGE